LLTFYLKNNTATQYNNLNIRFLPSIVAEKNATTNILGWTDGRTDRQKDGQMEGRTDRWTDGRTVERGYNYCIVSARDKIHFFNTEL
jgi:hypothetical protein